MAPEVEEGGHGILRSIFLGHDRDLRDQPPRLQYLHGNLVGVISNMAILEDEYCSQVLHSSYTASKIYMA